ncbi:hypothetical protein WR25_19417 [Diploscapter pachys]|uniref:Uncharacterized protein n=1 Tax=Diploscapter pachys TaxID=2018661 RepID=A0A2A2M1S8_9BILA|nr:hypothetical protein WR25_19417 [Diploscapter pachys]
MPKPRMKAVMMNWRWFSVATPSDRPIAGSAGSIESIPSAASDISAATSATNSTKPIGAPAGSGATMDGAPATAGAAQATRTGTRYGTDGAAHLPSERAHRLQYGSGMARHLHLAPRAHQRAVGAEQEGRALDAHIRLAVELLLTPHAERVADAAVLVTAQVHGQAMLGAKLGV